MPESQSRRDYLRQLLGTLTAGDVVITLNWDTTAGRTLQELGQWNPTTGYGFPKPLALGPVGSRCATDFDARQRAGLLDSPVCVLKLHGSFGWYVGPHGLYFDQDLLDPFGFQLDGERMEMTDPRQPESGPPEKQVLLYPSFLKQLDQPDLLRVWAEADRALRDATRVRIFGYSLPASDGGVRALLNPLRRRADCVEVSDPSAEARRRWRELFGPDATINENRLGNESAQ